MEILWKRNLRVVVTILFCFIFYCVCPFNILLGQESKKTIINAIEVGDVNLLKKLINSSNINSLLNEQGDNPLSLAINHQNVVIVKFLLNLKANPNYLIHGRNLLMYSVQQEKISITRLLIQNGAEINFADSFGNTALMMAATSNNIRFAKLLIRNGASLNVRNKKGYNARDFAIRSNNKGISVYLRSVFERNLPNFSDGPYVSFKGKKKIKVTYLKHDSLKHRSDLFFKYFRFKSFPSKFDGFAGDIDTYPIHNKFTRPLSEENGASKLLVIGDIHGQFDTLKVFLQRNNVVDKDLNWNFGNGVVVFIGDIFDRGEGVTEALWLIYKMEQQAKSVGGSVQLLLGNHEMMIFQDDIRYISEKYYYLFNNLKLNYHRYFNSKSLLGRWIRSKNTIFKMDSLLFVHGGIHPNILQYDASIDSINSLVYNYLNTKQKSNLIKNNVLQFLLSYNGPFWYRGLVEKSDGPLVPEDEINAILKYYGVKHIIIGHTYNSEVKTFYNGKIICTDVPFYLPDGAPMQALLFQDKKLFLLDTRGYLKPFDL